MKTQEETFYENNSKILRFLSEHNNFATINEISENTKLTIKVTKKHIFILQKDNLLETKAKRSLKTGVYTRLYKLKINNQKN